ncbi:hypothetical protein DM860_012855 [Cuscuta australis]|uniref:Uncharacterized protein n=1 Tax=Cuscuta australis TaxID=267555 RepID=A0A328DUT5_9ASTE|nr:hypothetical protein DM860_012855 [Cuscuta australis]
MDYEISGGDSECSSGCESGWTVYFENSYVSPHHHPCHDDDDDGAFLPMKSGLCRKSHYEEEEEEEDLSMVSDASSGPPHFAEEDDCGNYGCGYGHGGREYGRRAPLLSAPPLMNRSNGKVQRSMEENRRYQKSVGAEEPASALDDTASSPFFALMNNNFAINGQAENGVLDFSQGFSTNNFVCQEQYGFYHPSQIPGNQWFEEKKWE